MKKLFSLCLVLAMIAGCFSISVGAAEETSSIYLKLTSVKGTVATIDVCMNDAAKLGVSSMGLEFVCSENDVLVSCEQQVSKGSFVTSETVDVKPYKIFWVYGTGVLPYEETVICTLTMILSNATLTKGTLEVDLSYEANNPPADINGGSLADKIKLTEEYAFKLTASECDTNVGDANADGKINISDVSLMLKYIAKWSNLKIDTEKADVVNDGKIILSDVSMMLKHIAKWTSIRMGHNDSKEVIKKPTCQASGETFLTCKECGSTATVYPNPVPCDYRKTVVVAATCGSDGTDKYTCTMCGDSYTKTVAATGKHTYSGGICTVCKKADPSVSKAQIFANFIKSEGEYLSDGIYTISSYFEEENMIVSSDYDTGEGLVYLNAAIIDPNTNLCVSVYIDIPVKGKSSNYELTYLCYDMDTDYDYFIASCKINPKTFSTLTKVTFTDYSVTVDKANESMHAELANTLADTAIYYAELAMLVGGLDMSVSDLGFVGYN